MLIVNAITMNMAFIFCGICKFISVSTAHGLSQIVSKSAQIFCTKNFSKKFLRRWNNLGLLDAYHMERHLRVFPMNLENFIIIHLIHSSGPEPGGQYAVTACPVRGTKRGSP